MEAVQQAVDGIVRSIFKVVHTETIVINNSNFYQYYNIEGSFGLHFGFIINVSLVLNKWHNLSIFLNSGDFIDGTDNYYKMKNGIEQSLKELCQ